jgi:hypothetical protein
MKRFALMIGLLSLVPVTSAFGLDKGNVSYFCTVEASGGLAYDNSLRKWVGARFDPRGKFVFRLKYAKSTMKKDVSGVQSSIPEYEATITPAGTNATLPCFANAGNTVNVIIGEYGWVDCQMLFGNDYKFNLKSNRFLETFLSGFIDGSDSGSDTPYIHGGTCTKID